jgi:hypothetical protein
MMMIRWLHRLAHRLSWQLGTIVSAVDRRGTVWIGFKCATCGEVSGIHATHPPPSSEFT